MKKKKQKTSEPNQDLACMPYCGCRLINSLAFIHSIAIHHKMQWQSQPTYVPVWDYIVELKSTFSTWNNHAKEKIDLWQKTLKEDDEFLL